MISQTNTCPELKIINMVDAPNISELIAGSKKGDHIAFGEIVRFYTPTIAATAGRYARNETDREDLAQEVFIKAYRSLGKFRGRGSFEGWLRKITVHTCLDWLRKKKRDKSMSMSELGDDKREIVESTMDDSRGNEAEIKLNSEDSLKILQRAMSELQPEDHLVIVLKELEGKSIKDICAETGWRESNVKVRAHRARERLKKILENQGEIK